MAPMYDLRRTLSDRLATRRRVLRGTSDSLNGLRCVNNPIGFDRSTDDVHVETPGLNRRALSVLRRLKCGSGRVDTLRRRNTV